MQKSSSSTLLPPELRIKQRFRLQISIRPQNDVPKIELGAALQGGKPLRIAQGTTKLLTEDLVQIDDPDSTKEEIVITLVPTSGDFTLPGHIENQRFPGQARNSFTLEDLQQGRVSFVHDVSRTFYLMSMVFFHYYNILLHVYVDDLISIESENQGERTKRCI